MLTARGEEIDRIIGLSTGADDYMVKPFSPRVIKDQGLQAGKFIGAIAKICAGGCVGTFATRIN